MNRTLRTQRGIALVELALIMAFTVFLMLGVSFLLRGLWHAAVLHKAAHQAARIAAALPEEVFRNNNAATVIPEVARRVFMDVATEAGLEMVPTADRIMILCDQAACDNGVPQRVQVSVRLTFKDALFGGDLIRVTGLKPAIVINAIAVVPYVRE